MITYNGLPLYRVALASDQDGVLRVSLVDVPAVDSNFDVFRKEEAEGRKPALYSVQDEERRLVRGVILRADYPIYRRDNDKDPGYYVTFGADVIREAAEKYLADGRQNNVDTYHDGQEVDGVQMVQLFLKDSAAGVAPEGFDDIADGSLFGEYHVTNDDVWEEIKAGTFKGFSVEIFYTLIPAGTAMRREAEEVDEAAAGAECFDTLVRILSHITDMGKMNNLKARLARILAEFGSVTTDKGVIYWDGDEDLKAGDRVEVENAEGQRSAAADGDYVTQDGKTIVVVDGEVSEIKDSEAEVAAEEPSKEEAEQMARQERKGAQMAKVEQFGESYDEKRRHIWDAIAATLGEGVYGYLVEAGDDFAVANIYGDFNDWRDDYKRYKVTWNEDGTAAVSDPVDVRMAFVPMDFDDAALFSAEPAPETASVEEYEAAVKAAEEFKSENATLKARIAELEKTPAGQPARESFKAENGEGAAPAAANTFNGKDKGLNKLARPIR